MPQRIPKDVDLDVASIDSLSFKSLVCIQNQNQQTSPHSSYIHPIHTTKNTNSSEFEFSHVSQPQMGSADHHQYHVLDLDKLFSSNMVMKKTYSSSSSDHHKGIGRRNTNGNGMDHNNNNKKQVINGGKGGFGKKIMMFACKDCRTVESATVTREHAKG